MPKKTVKDFACIRTMDEARALRDKLLRDGRRIGFDVETGYHGPDRVRGALQTMWADQFVAGFSITNHKSWARYLPLHHDHEDNLPALEVWELFRPVLETLDMSAHHKKFEDKNLRTLHLKGDAERPIITMRGHDTMLDAYVLSEWEGVNTGDSIMSATGLKILTDVVLHVKQVALLDLFPKKPDGSTALTQAQQDAVRFNVLPLRPDVVAYACDDAALALELAEEIEERAHRERGLMQSIELAISELMVEVEIYGVGVDWEGMARAYAQYQPFRASMEKAVKAGFGAMAGRDLTGLALNSPKQMKELLYDELGLKSTRKTNTGQPSTDKVALEALSKRYPSIKKLLELRQVENMGKRLQKWLEEYRINMDDRVHPNYAQTVVGTGRFAANDPTIQQCPKEWRWTSRNFDAWAGVDWDALVATDANGTSYWTGNFRDFIIAAPGYYLLTFDYSQIELRVLAGVSEEAMLLDAFENDQDVHTLTAAMMLGKRVEDVDPKTERPVGKTQNFALMYQMGTQSLAERLAITKERADQLYAEYFRQFSSVQTWMERTKREGLRCRYAVTPFGRKYTVWELHSTNRKVYSKGERVLINAPIQGGAADYMKLAMIRAKKVLTDAGLWGNGVMITMNQHDALTFEVREDIDPNGLRDLLQGAVVFDPREMIRGFAYNFPKIVADWEIGVRWGSGRPWGMDAVAAWDGHAWVPGASAGAGTTPAPSEPVGPVLEHAKKIKKVKAKKLKKVAEAPSPPAPSSELIVQIEEMPDDAHLMGLVTLLEDHPGARPVTLRTPEGDLGLPLLTSLGMRDRAKISLSIGGATVHEAADDANLDALAARLDL